jgi:hypothetical protein
MNRGNISDKARVLFVQRTIKEHSYIDFKTLRGRTLPSRTGYQRYIDYNITQKLRRVHHLGHTHNFRKPCNLHSDHKQNVRHTYSPYHSLPQPQLQVLVKTVPWPPHRWQKPLPLFPLPSHFGQSLVTAWHSIPLMITKCADWI